MAERVNLSGTYPKRDYLIALRNGNVCCPFCEDNNPDCFSRDGLRQHYRLVHKHVEFKNDIYNDGAALLRTRAASETMKNLLNLSQKRMEMVSEKRIFIILE